MPWSHFVTLLSVVGFLITAAGLVGVSFKVGRNAQTVSNYRDSANAWESKARAQSDEIAELQDKLIANDAVIKKLEDRVQILEELVTSASAITSLAASIDSSFANLQTHIDSAVDKIRKDIRVNHG